ncbi:MULTISPECIES: PAS and ANTAR domain-containing protein [Mycobacterium]|uniref:Transcription antitermination regulator n=1 Tax=Mycobacterium kiyosense TaxID=2871094 RepID=A0A9P3Q3J4_9MYCO|nr:MULTISPECIES: PAS and ANTAR domain-containing protein [Mycobacterium]BDB42333.1 putative transcription antitermination regulator [Mycobacterium kiyosense]BDE14396.1 putative transcription antitermination regulator [Mycobacterium sp. 20KCMC460]GLB83260.1 putative transcription antitermination regulator [Mycobacterium kiyosense]GLB91236.1 putative transcription antitermination regulator [Mycobacterium kiyosense]GLB97876.1 putative transcription antitermination regulator [Mycobacterium kiyosen
MKRDLDDQSAAVQQALAGDSPQRVGSFRFYFADRRWEWSRQLHQMHGYAPGEINPTTELLLSHKHPEDRDRVAAMLDEMLRTRRAFSTRHRILDTAGNVHHVVVVGDQLFDDDGNVIGTHGFFVDVAPPTDTAQQDLVTAKLAEIAENRAGIEQAKGMLMLVYDIGEDTAFDLLKWLSQDSNVKLRPLAEQIVADFRGARECITLRSTFDQLLLTAHTRVSRD